MANPNELKLNDEQVEGDFDNMPTGMSSVLTPPQPGIYVFQLPSAEVLYEAFDTVDHEQQGQRLQLSLKDASALKNISANSQPYHANLSNVTRTLNYRSGPVVVSDLAMLLKALGIVPESMTNAGFAQAVLHAGGMSFRGEHTLTSNCNPKRDIYLSEGGEQKGRKGCGQRYAVDSYQPKTPPGARVVLAIPREEENPNLIQTRFDCVCGASLRSWGKLRGFKGIKQVDVPSPPTPDEVEALVKDVGVMINTMAPTPSPACQLVVFGHLFNTLCRIVEADPASVLLYIDNNYDAEVMSSEEFLDRVQRESN